MSQLTAAARPTPRVTRRPVPRRPDLRVVTTSPRPARRLPFVVLCAALLSAGLLTLLGLNMALAAGSYALHDLRGRSALLAEQEQVLTEQVSALSAPAALAERAGALGMVASVSPGFLRLPDGTVVGDPRPAPAPSAPAVAPRDAATTVATTPTTRPAPPQRSAAPPVPRRDASTSTPAVPPTATRPAVPPTAMPTPTSR